ncbi:MAG: mannose-1-phosphate guanylyltransferase/mannose-6-phosphate isomerase [Chromatiales bacterium]|nr:MAG: mannose-1-phosphate guanylyltransferase/mannose-6-phosphate isomerase [Chromatiales bacterium]
MSVIPVILCGGSGTRLWPLSRAGLPKQLLPLAAERTMLQDTAARLEHLDDVAAPLVICNEAHRFLVSGQLEALGMNPTLVLEPEGRNTAPAVALAALEAQRAGLGAVPMLVLPADHVIREPKALALAVETGLQAARSGQLVTFGIVPTAPETGYGYIRGAAEAGGVRPVEQFVEKPDTATAQQYLDDGNYFWNSGMFLFTADAYLQELGRQAPDMVAACHRAMGAASDDGLPRRPDPEAFRACPKDSIDYAVMEKTSLASMVPLDAGWSDVGSWSALHDVSARDEDGNTLLGDVRAVQTRDSYVRAESRLVTTVGLEGCIVVETKDAVLVVPRERAQDVKAIVDALGADEREEVKLGREVFRPWGSYDSLESVPGYQVKRLTVLPGAVLSLQLHHHRAEHWVVVAGTARITRDDEVFDLEKNQHTFIPIGARHRIENPGQELLHIIEVQVGDYLGEDDIVRFEDKYGREGRTD